MVTDPTVQHQLGLPVLYTFRRCPYAMRARLALLASGCAVEVREIVLRDKPAHLRDISPKATVPVLWLTNGTVIDQSLDVMRWAVGQHWPAGWLQTNLVQTAQGDAWLALLDGPFKQALDRYKYPNRYDHCDPLPHRQVCVDILKTWDAHLAGEGSAWLFGDQPGFYDCAILPFVRQFRIADEAWFDAQTEFPVLQQWLQRFLTADWFEAAMPKLAPWKAGDAPLRFPA